MSSKKTLNLCEQLIGLFPSCRVGSFFLRLDGISLLVLFIIFSCLRYLGSGTCLKFCWAKNAFTVTYLAEHVCMNFMFCWIQVSAQLPLLFCGLFIGGAAEEGSFTTNRGWWLTCSWKFTTAAYWQIPLSWPLAMFIIWSWSHGSSTGTT